MYSGEFYWRIAIPLHDSRKSTMDRCFLHGPALEHDRLPRRAPVESIVGDVTLACLDRFAKGEKNIVSQRPITGRIVRQMPHLREKRIRVDQHANRDAL